MKTITLPQVLDALRQAVAERGENFSYQGHYTKDEFWTSCQYVEVTDDGAEPACIAGNALHKLGVPIDTLMSMDRAAIGESSVTVNSPAADRILRASDFSLDVEARSALRVAQQEQDNNRVWGEALHRTERLFADVLAQ